MANQTDVQNTSASVSDESCCSKKPTRLQLSCFFGTLLFAVAGISILAFLMLKIVPDFEKIFVDFDMDLPVMTHIVIAAANLFAWVWWCLLLLVPLVLWLFIKGRTFPAIVLNLLSLLFGIISVVVILIGIVVFISVFMPLIVSIAELST